jgi:hypothetical protein
MGTLQSTIEDNVTDFLRKTARQYGDAVTQYGNTFISYGKGEIDATKVAEATLRLATVEAQRAVETGINLGTAYAKWVSSLVGVTEVKRPIVKPATGKVATGKAATSKATA